MIISANGLECFTCDEENWNHKDCTNKRQQCDSFQDACTTYIRYGVPDKFNARNYRRYFISKGCDTRSGCEKRLAATTLSCQKSYYNDWACVECCTSDSCNFHVAHLGAGSIRASFIMTALSAITVGVLTLGSKSLWNLSITVHIFPFLEHYITFCCLICNMCMWTMILCIYDQNSTC